MAIIIGIIISFLLICLGYLLLTYALRWYEISNQPSYWPKYGDRTLSKIGPHNYILFAKEYFYLVIHMLILFIDYLLTPYYYLRGERDGLINDRSPKAPPIQSSRNPVIVLHGYMMRGGTMWMLRRRLRKDGERVWLFNYGPAFGSIAHFARQLQNAVEKLLDKTGRSKVDLIGHSMGGLVILHYLNQLNGAQRVQRVITLGTPFSGSKLWAFSLGRCGEQMRPNSRLLQGLKESDLPKSVNFTAIYSDFDELVIPNENAHLDKTQVTNKKISQAGHVGLIFSESVYNIIRESLQRKGKNNVRQKTGR